MIVIYMLQLSKRDLKNTVNIGSLSKTGHGVISGFLYSRMASNLFQHGKLQDNIIL